MECELATPLFLTRVRWCLKGSLFSPQATQRGSRRAPDHLSATMSKKRHSPQNLRSDYYRGNYFARVVKPSKVGFTTHRGSKSQVKWGLLPA